MQVVMQVNKQKTTIRRDGCFFACRKIKENKVQPLRHLRCQLTNKLGDSLFFMRHVVPLKKVLYLSPDKGAEGQGLFF